MKADETQNTPGVDKDPAEARAESLIASSVARKGRKT
jgi:hypothetical protein